EDAAVASARRLQSEFIWDLLEGRIPDEAEALVRSKHLGHGFELPARLVLVRSNRSHPVAASRAANPEELERMRGREGRRIVESVQERTGVRPLLARRADVFVAVVPVARADPSLSPRDLGTAALSGGQSGGMANMA